MQDACMCICMPMLYPLVARSSAIRYSILVNKSENFLFYGHNVTTGISFQFWLIIGQE